MAAQIFRRALLKLCSPNFADGITLQQLGVPDLQQARLQHQLYARALESAGLELTILPADQNPDSCFVEDMALVGTDFTILVRPGHPSRMVEAAVVHQALRKLLPEHVFYQMPAPGSLDGGDVLCMDDEWHVGVSHRTNQEGRKWLADVLRRHGLSCRPHDTRGLLHLKTGVSRLDAETVVAHQLLSREFAQMGYRVIEVSEEECHAANVVAVNSMVVLPANCPRVSEKIAIHGYEPLSVPLSEFAKQDGGASCLSILLP